MQSKQWKILANPLLRNVRVFIQQGRWWSNPFGIVRGDPDWLSWTRPHDKWCILWCESRRLRQVITRKKWGKLTCGVLLLQDNAPAYTSQVAMTSATEFGFEFLPHPPYSSDMGPSDYYLFPKLKSHLGGTQYGSNKSVIEAMHEYLGDQEMPSILKELISNRDWLSALPWMEIILKSNGQIFIPL